MSASSSHRILGLFAKQPLPGQVKTRLAAATSAAWAARVADAFLRDTVERLSRLPARRILAFTPPDAEDFFAELVRSRFLLVPQADGDLGQRLAAFFRDPLPTVLLGTDSPTLPLALVEQAFTELERADLVIGPATDGGYYLIGCAGAPPPIFTGIAWSSSRALIDTIARLADPRTRLALLPPWYDVDTLGDWEMLRGHLAAMRRAGADPELPHVEELSCIYPYF